jgi:hypothetical protein
VSPVKYELGFYIPEDDILNSHRRENLKSYVQFSSFNQIFIMMHTVTMKDYRRTWCGLPIGATILFLPHPPDTLSFLSSVYKGPSPRR